MNNTRDYNNETLSEKWGREQEELIEKYAKPDPEAILHYKSCLNNMYWMASHTMNT